MRKNVFVVLLSLFICSGFATAQDIQDFQTWPSPNAFASQFCNVFGKQGDFSKAVMLPMNYDYQQSFLKESFPNVEITERDNWNEVMINQQLKKMNKGSDPLSTAFYAFFKESIHHQNCTYKVKNNTLVMDLAGVNLDKVKFDAIKHLAKKIPKDNHDSQKFLNEAGQFFDLYRKNPSMLPIRKVRVKVNMIKKAQGFILDPQHLQILASCVMATTSNTELSQTEQPNVGCSEIH